MKPSILEMQQKIDSMPDSKLADLAATLVFILLGKKALKAFVNEIEVRVVGYFDLGRCGGFG